MTPLCTSRHYLDQDIFSKEQENIFQGIWQLIGFKLEIENHHDYLCRKVGRQSVLVQNFRGELKAFHNVCPHRSSQIHHQETGNRPLQCPYHGWTFDREGIPTGIPHVSNFEHMNEDRRKALSLESWQVDFCGQFIFVKKKKDAISLKKFLGNTYGFLEQISEAIHEKIDLNRYMVKANWKIALENALESYHARVIHPKTFARLGTSGCDYRFEETHSTWFSNVSESANKKWKRVKNIYESRPFHTEGYFNHLIFPNVTLVSMYGTTFSVQCFSPVTPSETLVSSYVFSTKLEELSATGKVIYETMNKAAIKFDRDVFEEDRLICEQVQLGMEESHYPGILGEEEKRIFYFHTAYQLTLAEAGNLPD